MLCGCQKEEMRSVEEVTVPQTFTATIGEGATKTVLGTGDNAGKVLWEKGDLVSVFAGSDANSQYKVSDESAGKTTATLVEVSTPSGESSSMGYNAACYPYSSNITFKVNGKRGEIIGYNFSNVILPNTQTYVENSFASGAFPMVAVNTSTENTDFQFKNVLGGLKIQLKGTATIKSVSVSGNNDEMLSGNATVNALGTPSVSINGSADEFKTVTLDCGEGVQLSETEATSFIIALPPMTMSKGFTITVKDTEGKQMELTSTREQTITRSALLRMPEVVYDNTDYTQEPFTITAVDGTALQFSKGSSAAADITLYYSTDGKTWSAYTVGSSISLQAGEYVQFRAGDTENTSLGNYKIVVTGNGNIRASGNVMSLLDKTMAATEVGEKAFYLLFYGCEKLTDASNLILPATTLAASCYQGMFSGCTSLTSAPELPTTTLAYGCYREMFYNCTSLTSAPELPATTLAPHCYYSMFYECTSLTSAPTLPAATLETRCYYQMFNGCSKLGYIKALFTSIPTSGECLRLWVGRVASEGTFVMSKDAEWEAEDNRGAYGIPNGWTVQTE